MLARDDLTDYLLDHYGACDRDKGDAGNDCYWGKDARGDWNGCLRTGWRGRECKHWHPCDPSRMAQHWRSPEAR